LGRKKSSNIIDGFDEKNASALAEMLVDVATSEAVRLQIINELNTEKKNETFFEAMYNEELSLGPCPRCHHKNHWLIPEDELAQMGWVSYKKDDRVKQHTTAKDCEAFEEACSKKKVTA
jgi:hypothetical protein